ncbi:MAG: hypothetical protein U0768_12210 [Anaerolineae bacterium]
MPKLVLFAPCDKAIVDQETNSLSLIAILENIRVPIVDGITVPADTSAPLTWACVSMWQRIEGDANKEFEQRICLLLPDGQEAIESITSFQMTDLYMRSVLRVNGFPVGQEGEHTLRLAVRETGAEPVWRTVADFVLNVIHEAVT